MLGNSCLWFSYFSYLYIYYNCYLFIFIETFVKIHVSFFCFLLRHKASPSERTTVLIILPASILRSIFMNLKSYVQQQQIFRCSARNHRWKASTNGLRIRQQRPCHNKTLQPFLPYRNQIPVRNKH